MMGGKAPDRDSIVEALVEAIQPLDYVYALWEGGAVAFDRVDEWSDIDICVDAEDERVRDVFPVAERALESLAPIELKYDMPSPSLGEYVQAFYRLKGTSECLLIDLAIFKHSAPDKLLESEIHGNSRFHFNKNDAVVIPSLDRSKFMDKIRARLEQIQQRLETFGCFVAKEINRGSHIEALGFYHRLTLGALVEVLRIRHKPVRFEFGTRYVYHDLPGGVVKRMEELYFVKDAADLRAKVRLAEQWFTEAVKEIDLDRVEENLKNT
jgi:hypothetical protein